MPGLPNPWLLLGFVLLLGTAVTVAYLSGHGAGIDEENARWTIASEQQKKEAAQTLAVETQRVLELERRNSELSAALDTRDKEHRDELDRAYDRARRDAAAAGGLRDPGARRGCGGDLARGKDAPAPGGAQPTPAGGAALSQEAEQFLFGFAREADQLNLDFERVRADAQQCRALNKEVSQ